MAVLLVWLARCSLLLTLIAAPWAIGGAELPSQRWLVLGILVAGILGWLGAMLRGALRLSRPAALLLMLAAGLLTIGAIQLLPHPHSPEFPRAELTAELGVLDGDDSPAAARSLEPAATRLWMSRLAVAVVAFLSGAWLFWRPQCAALALGGAGRQRHCGRWLWARPAGVLERQAVLVHPAPTRRPAVRSLRKTATTPPNTCRCAWLEHSACGQRAVSPNVRQRERFQVFDPLWFRRSQADAHRLSGGVMILLLFGGVLATLSRAGALSSVAGVLLVGAWVGAGRRSRTLLLPLLGIVVAAVAWLALTDQAAQLRSRLGSLGGSYATDGRIRHWMDMRNAVRRFPGAGDRIRNVPVRQQTV